MSKNQSVLFTTQKGNVSCVQQDYTEETKSDRMKEKQKKEKEKRIPKLASSFHVITQLD